MAYWPVAKEISFKVISILALWPCCSTELKILINFGRRHHEEHFFEIILNLDQLFRRRSQLKIFLIYSSSSLFVQCFQPICAIMVVGFIYFCETVLTLEQ